MMLWRRWYKYDLRIALLTKVELFSSEYFRLTYGTEEDDMCNEISWIIKRFNHEPIIYIFAENDEDAWKAVDEALEYWFS